MQWAPAGAVTMTEVGYLQCDFARRVNYKGRFHLYARCRQTSGAAGDLSMRLRFTPYYFTGSFYSQSFVTETRNLQYIQTWEMLDFGVWSLLPEDSGLATEMPSPCIRIEMSNNVSAARTVYLFDLVLIPCDEWFGVWEEIMDASSGINSLGIGYNRLESRYEPKVALESFTTYTSATSRYKDVAIPVYASGEFRLAPRQAMRLHFLFGFVPSPPSTSSIRQYPPVSWASVGLGRIQRYKFARGRR